MSRRNGSRWRMRDSRLPVIAMVASGALALGSCAGLVMGHYTVSGMFAPGHAQVPQRAIMARADLSPPPREAPVTEARYFPATYVTDQKGSESAWTLSAPLEPTPAR